MNKSKLTSLSVSIRKNFGKNVPVIVQATGMDIEDRPDCHGSDVFLHLDNTHFVVLGSDKIDGEPIRHCDTFFAWIDNDDVIKISRRHPFTGKTPDEVAVDVKSMFPILEHFAYEHLPPHLQSVSKQFHDIANKMVEDVMSPAGGPEVSAGLRKLLEAKDCMVRAAVLGVKK